MTREEQRWFEENRVKALCIMGTDYYLTNEHLLHADGSTSASGEIMLPTESVVLALGY